MAGAKLYMLKFGSKLDVEVLEKLWHRKHEIVARFWFFSSEFAIGNIVAAMHEIVARLTNKVSTVLVYQQQIVA